MNDPARSHIRLTDAIRALIEQSVMTDCESAELDSAARLVEDATELIKRRTPYERVNLVASTPQWDPRSEMPTHPIVGDRNPLATGQLQLTGTGSSLSGQARFDLAYQGPDGLVHGGVVAGLFDALQATSASAAIGSALTHTLTIRYLKGTPVEQPLELDAHVDRIDGRKVFTVSTIKAGGEVTAESTGFFVRNESAERGPS